MVGSRSVPSSSAAGLPSQKSIIDFSTRIEKALLSKNILTMRFDNTARMQQLDGILKPNKSSRRLKAKGDGSGESLKSGLSTLAESTNFSSGASISRCSVSSRGSRTRRSAAKVRPLSLGCKDVVVLQQSWNQLKASQVSERSIGENILASSGQTSSPERMESLSKLIVETIDSIVSLAGPNLFDEDFETSRLAWIEQDLDPCLVSKVLIDSLRACTVEDIFSDNVLEAWKSTVVPLVNSWGNLN